VPTDCVRKNYRGRLEIDPMLRLLLLFTLLFSAVDALAAPRVIKGKETWSGKIVLHDVVTIPTTATLTVQPGTEIRFSENALLAIEGRLLAKGTAAQPIAFRSAKGGAWPGLSFSQGNREGSELSNVTIDGAATALSITGAKVIIKSSTLRNGGKGIASGGGSYLHVENVTVSGMKEGGIDASVGTQGGITSSRLQRVGEFGIQVGKKATLTVRDNQISDTKIGIFISGEFPSIEGNIIDRCDTGVVVLQAGPNSSLRRNKISKSKIGIACHQFAAPVIERNIIEGCDEGIQTFQGASPQIHQNRFSGNKRAITAVQMCNPDIRNNDLVDNDSAIYLHLSSYPQIHENNFERNRLHIELDNMSYDWEVRAGRKPVRNRDKQSEILTKKNRPQVEGGGVTVDSEGFVNAKENYWGEETTREMESKGANANIKSIQDGFDVPTRTYEGWPGSYKQDKVKYDGWKKTRIAGTGP